MENGYPLGFIHRHSCPPRPRPPADDVRSRTSVTLPYIGGLSEAIRWILRPLEIQVVFRPLTTLRQLLVHPKDPVPMEERKGVVYSIPCTDCPKVYIGQTGRCLKHRLKEHHRDLKDRGCGSFCSCGAYMDNGPQHGSYQVNGTGLSPTHHHTMPPGKLAHPEKY